MTIILNNDERFIMKFKFQKCIIILKECIYYMGNMNQTIYLFSHYDAVWAQPTITKVVTFCRVVPLYRGCNPVTPVECVSLSFGTHPCFLAFITHIFLCIKWIELALVWVIKYTFRYVLFKFTICFNVLVNLGETCHLKRRDMVTVWRKMLFLCCYYCDCIMSPCSLNAYCDVTQSMDGLWIFITKLELPKGVSQT